MAAMTCIVDVATGGGTPDGSELLVAGFKVRGSPLKHSKPFLVLHQVKCRLSACVWLRCARARGTEPVVPVCQTPHMTLSALPAGQMMYSLTSARGVQANKFMLWDVEAEVELLSTSSGGWRRPFAVWIESGSCFTVVLLKERQLKIITRRGPCAAVEQPHMSVPVCEHPACMPHSRDGLDTRFDTSAHVKGGAVDGRMPQQATGEKMHARALVLMPPHHSSIVHACLCLQLSTAQLAVVTASEDGSVRVVTFRCASLVFHLMSRHCGHRQQPHSLQPQRFLQLSSSCCF